MLRTFLLFGVLSFWPRLAEAGPAVYYTDGLDAAAAAAMVKRETGLGDFRVEGLVDSLAVGGPEALQVVGLSTTRCQVERTAVGEVVIRAKAAIDEMEYSSVAAALTEASSYLPCGAKGVTRDALYALHFLNGLAAFNRGDANSARTAFTAAAVIDPGLAWPSEYPPTAQPLFLEALQAALRSPAVVFTSVPAGLVVDGAAVAADTPLSLVPGPHVLQLHDAVLSVVVPPGAKGHALAVGQDLALGVTQGTPLSARWFAEASSARGEEALLVRPDGVFRSLNGQWVAAGRGRNTSIRPAVVLAAAGGAAVAVGLALNIGSYDAAALSKVGDQWVSEGESASYPRLQALNGIGLGTAITGAVVAAVGIGWGVRAEVIRHRGVRTVALPWLHASGEGVTLGLSGRW